MNDIMKFENIGVEIIKDDKGEPLFELYSTGMALGQFRMAKGKCYPRKDRINENVKNADITAVDRNGQLFLTENQLYDFMLEVRTEKCRKFRKWVTTEVLPSIRKTGSYSVKPEPQYEQLQLEEKPYKYIEKTFGGKIVLTSADFEYLCGKKRTSVDHKLRNKCIEDVDYKLLNGKSMAEFKAENPKYNYHANFLLVIFKSGFDKLADIYGLTVETPYKAIGEKKTEPKKPKNKDESINECVIALGVLGSLRERLAKSDNSEAVKALNIALKFAAWELSIRTTG